MFPRPGEKWQAAGAAAALAGLVLWATWQRWSWLAGDPYPVGVDGYYYAVQVRALLEDGALHYPAAPLAFVWLLPFAGALGVIPGIKLGAALGTSLAVVPAYLLARRLAGGARGPALLGAVLVATSASSAFLAGEFLKQGLGLTVGLAALAALAAALDAPTRGRLVLAAALFAATPLTHKTSAAFVVALGVPALVVAVARRRPAALRPLLAGLAGLAAVAALLGALAPERFLGARDLGVAAGLLGAEPRWQLPALVTRGHTVLLGHDALVAAGLGVVVLVLGVLGRREAPGPLPPLAWGFVALALVVGLPWLAVDDPQGGAFRLRAAVFVVLAPLAALAAARLGAALAAPPRAVALAALGAATGLLVARADLVVDGASHTHPAFVQAARALAGELPPGATVLTQDRKLAFMTRWYARRAARLKPPAADRLDAASTYRLIPGAFLRPGLRAELGRLAAERPPGVTPPRALHAFDEHGLVLMTETTFQWLVARLPADEQAYYARWSGT